MLVIVLSNLMLFFTKKSFYHQGFFAVKRRAVFIPNQSLGLVVFRNFRRMNFACLLMSDSELLRIKNKQKASYKSRKTARSNPKKLIRPNDRFGFILGAKWIALVRGWRRDCVVGGWKLVSNDAKRTIPPPNAKHSTLLQGCFLCFGF